MATNFVSASIQEVYDLQTQDSYQSLLKIHAPTGGNIQRRLHGFFTQFKQYRYVGAKVTLVPASTLPADPLQLSYEAGEPGIDPRDMVNPILWKFYHGESLSTDPLPSSEKTEYGSSDNVQGLGHSLEETKIIVNSAGFYHSALVDPSYRKSSIQRGFSAFVKPFVYNLASLFQSDAGSDGETLYHLTHSGTNNYTSVVGPVETNFVDHTDTPLPANTYDYSWPQGMMFTNKLQRLGWMDTVTGVTRDPLVAGGAGDMRHISMLPEIPMLLVILPPAYKTEFYFRLVITHIFEFRKFCSSVVIDTIGEIADPWAPTTASSANSLSVEGIDIIGSADGAL